MSVQIISPEHINALITAAVLDGGVVFGEVGAMRPTPVRNLSESQRNTLHFVLAYTNYKAFYQYYPSQKDRPAPDPKECIYNEVLLPGEVVDVVGYIKLLKSYVYQCDSWAHWGTSAAKDFCDSFMEQYIQQLPGYNERPWTI